MKETELTFEQFPLRVPSEKKISAKLEDLIKEVEECGSYLTAKTAIKHWNKFGNELATDATIIQVRYSLDTKNPVYKRAQDKLDELMPLFSAYETK